MGEESSKYKVQISNNKEEQKSAGEIEKPKVPRIELPQAVRPPQVEKPQVTAPELQRVPQNYKESGAQRGAAGMRGPAQVTKGTKKNKKKRGRSAWWCLC